MGVNLPKTLRMLSQTAPQDKHAHRTRIARASQLWERGCARGVRSFFGNVDKHGGVLG